MKAARLDAMEQYILQNGQVSIEQLQERFGISINTLRRDLTELEQRGHVGKIYGGVTARSPASLLTMPQRFQINLPAKQRIGELAATVIPDNATVYIDSGSTTRNVVQYLGGRRSLTLISHSMAVLNAATALKEITLISPGGIYNASIGAFVGLSTLETIRSLTVQIAVMAATGVTIEHGLSNTTYFEAEVKRGGGGQLPAHRAHGRPYQIRPGRPHQLLPPGAGEHRGHRPAPGSPVYGLLQDHHIQVLC